MRIRLSFAALAAAVALACPATAVVTTTTTSVSCTASGGALTCATPFPFWSNTDLVVTLDGVLQVLGTQYTVSGAGAASGGAVTMVTNPTAGQVLAISRIVPLKQSFNARAQGPFRPSSYEQAFDQLTAQVQQTDAKIPLAAAGAAFVTQSPMTGNGTVASPLSVTGSSLLATATGSTTARTLAARAADVINVKDYGAVGDNSTDNATAFAAVATVVNATAASANSWVTVYFPPGTYLYTSGLTFTRSVRLTGHTATLNYTGSATAVKMGPDGLTSVTYVSHLHYQVDGLSFIGGASMTQGIYFNKFVTQPRVRNCSFINFGSTTSQWAVYFQSQNWDARVTDTRMYANDAATHNFIRSNGIDSDGTTSDQGQSRLTVDNILATNQATATGTVIGVYSNGALSSISNSKIEGFAPAIQIGSNAGASSWGTRVLNVYMEVVRGSNPCIMFGETAGTYVGVFSVMQTYANNYCNTHNTDFATTAKFLGPASASSGLQRATVNGNTAVTVTAANPLVVQNNLASQAGNRARDNVIGNSSPITGPSATFPLHSTGGSIAGWTDLDEANVTVQAPSTSAQASLLWVDSASADIGRIECSGAAGSNRCTVKGAGGTNSFQWYSTGQFALLKGIDGDSIGLKHKRVTTGSIATATDAAVAVTWGTAFADAFYTVTCNVVDATTSNSSLKVVHFDTVTAATATVRVRNDSGGSLTGTLHCIAVHD